MEQAINKRISIFSNAHCQVHCLSEYASLKDNFFDLADYFYRYGDSIHRDRNEIKVFDSSAFPGIQKELAIKSFKVPNMLSAIIYRFLRPSKAKRSFFNSLLLLENGFSVPEPIACVEYYDKGVLAKSFYLSKKIDFDCTLHDVNRAKMFQIDDVLPLVVEQAFLMHKKNLIHRDFSGGNVLVTHEENLFSFSFVDLNRLYIGRVTFKMGLSSLVRLISDEHSLIIIAKNYARYSGEVEGRAIDLLKYLFTQQQRQKKRKEKVKNLLGISKRVG